MQHSHPFATDIEQICAPNLESLWEFWRKMNWFRTGKSESEKLVPRWNQKISGFPWPEAQTVTTSVGVPPLVGVSSILVNLPRYRVLLFFWTSWYSKTSLNKHTQKHTPYRHKIQQQMSLCSLVSWSDYYYLSCLVFIVLFSPCCPVNVLTVLQLQKKRRGQLWSSQVRNT